MSSCISRDHHVQGTYPCLQRRDCHGGLAAGLHDARLLLPGGVHHHTEEECHSQQISGENQKRSKLSTALFQWGEMKDMIRVGNITVFVLATIFD